MRYPAAGRFLAICVLMLAASADTRPAASSEQAGPLRKPLDDFESTLRWKTYAKRGATVKATLDKRSAEGKRAMRLDLAMPTRAESGGRAYATLELEPTDFSGYDGLQFQLLHDRPCDCGLSILIREKDGSWYRGHPKMNKADVGNWHRVVVPFNEMKWFFERKPDANKQLDLDGIAAIQFFFSLPPGTKTSFFVDGVELYKVEPPPTENIIALKTGQSGQLFFLPAEIVVRASARKPRIKGKARWRFEARDIDGRVVAMESTETDDPTREIEFRFKDVGYFDISAELSDETGTLREKKFSVGAVEPLREADDAVTEGSPFGLWVGGFTLQERLGIRWARIYCQPWDFEPADGGYKWIAPNRQPFHRNLAGKFPKMRFICFFRGMPQWLTTRPDRPDSKKFPPKDWDEYGRFIRYYVSNTKDLVKVWEVWNEPVPYAYWMGTIEEVVKLHEVTYKAVHAAQPEAIVIGPCPYTFKWDFLEKFFELGGAQWIDAVVVHAYRPYAKGPEETGYFDDLMRLRDMIARHPHLKDIYITELGWHSWQVGERRQADYLVRSIVQTLAADVRVIIWHMFWDWKSEDAGILRHDQTPKPALIAYAVLAQRLLRARYLGPVTGLTGKSLGYRFKKDGAERWVLWNWGDRPGNVELNVGDRACTVCDMFGRPVEARPAGGRLRLRLDAHPKYVTLR